MTSRRSLQATAIELASAEDIDTVAAAVITHRLPEREWHCEEKSRGWIDIGRGVCAAL